MLMRMGRGIGAHNARCEGVQPAPATHNTIPPHGPSSFQGDHTRRDVVHDAPARQAQTKATNSKGHVFHPFFKP